MPASGGGMNAPQTRDTLEAQLAAVLNGSDINTLQISAVLESDGAVRFYSALHGNEGGCVFSDGMNLPTVREAIEGGLNALAKRRCAAVAIADLSPLADAA